MNRKPENVRLGLALGSGAARGLAHIGLIKVLEAEGIRPVAVAGTSIGALIGALYAAGVPAADMEDVALRVDWRQLGRLVRPTVPTSGLIDSERLERFLAELLPVRAFSELQIPLAMAATDIESGEAMILRQGELLPALRAAIAFPGIFPPVRIGQRFLVDGGLCHPVPVGAVRELGANRILGLCAIPEVDKRSHEAWVPSPHPRRQKPRGSLFGLINADRVDRLWRDIWGRNDKGGDSKQEERRPPNIFRVFAQSVAIMENQINALRLEKEGVDLLLRPQFAGINMLEFHRGEEIIRAGEEAARQQLPAIRRLIAAGG
ncbi:NTE family protein [Geothermobacter ehrlichii]|uniref:NTE family protein n=1 Tax=Geothermobacter ehrlichii TaxID=213224 RepID=A0A5D3WIL7_9BACT|nr:patatin-like phospholipase family protein [Geothermobacter ehrlichii]TYO98304.1 NTE family protein [Geothermobacter ehrlichii]